ncbi:MAG TPA: lipoate--protein ligase family protein [Geobacteraceae bacterium]
MFPWRLIDTGPLDGPANMAVDEALLAGFDPARSRPVLRLYGWEPPAISLGRFQRPDEVVDLAKSAAAGVPVVRRITGGGAVYHAGELTYAIVCAPHHIPPVSSVKDSFRVLTSFLLRCYRQLGLDPRYAVDHSPVGAGLGERTPVCFAGKESYDILIGGRKIGGNAQRRLKNVIFQHGSIPLENRIAEGSGFFLGRLPRLSETAVALRECGVALSFDELKKGVAGAFREAVASGLQPDRLTGEEEELVDRLREERRADGGRNPKVGVVCG